MAGPARLVLLLCWGGDAVGGGCRASLCWVGSFIQPMVGFGPWLMEPPLGGGWKHKLQLFGLQNREVP